MFLEVRPSVQPPPPELAIIESAVTDQIQPQQEIVSVPEQHPEKEITSIPEQAPKKVIADIQEKEKSKEEEIQSILEKAVIPKKRKSLRQLQADEIEEQRRIPERRMSKEERERGKKVNIRIKIKTKLVFIYWSFEPDIEVKILILKYMIPYLGFFHSFILFLL